MKKSLLTFFFGFIAAVCFGQSASPFRQFYFNPYLSNPAYAGINGSTELYVSYRRQWININDAPTTMGISFQYPTKKRVSLGLNIISDEVVALRNTSVLGTFAYALPLTSTQTLRFGLSGGVGMNDLHLKEGEYDPNDPDIINASQNNFYVDGNFGALYTNRGFRLGFAFTQLFDGNRFSSQSFDNVKVSSLNNRLYSIGYKFPIGSSGIAIEPYFLYRERADKQNSWEAASVVYIKDKFWIGGSYHQTLGMGFFLGLDIKQLFKFGYSYELPPVNKEFTSTSSHELQLSLRLGKKREQTLITKKSQKTVAPTAVKEDSVKTKEEPIDVAKNEEPTEIPREQEPIDSNPVTQSEQTSPPAGAAVASTPADADQSAQQSDNGLSKDVPKPVKTPSKPPRSFALAKGHYVVAGAFKVMQNAMGYSQDLMLKGYSDVTVAINPKNNLYYVYIFSSYDIEEARKVRNQYRIKRPFSEIWVFTAE
ncbi:MAG: PorP/SprF family type IX secretion system membrane protein [Chryseolinea sp.]